MKVEMSVRDAAVVCKVPVRTIYRWIADGTIPARHPSKRSTLVNLEDVLVADEKRRDSTGFDGQ